MALIYLGGNFMAFKKGQILNFEYEIKKNSKVIEDVHRVVVLYSRETPYKTVTIAPITSLESLKTKKKVPSNYLELKAKDYPFLLEHDSYVNLDMILTVDGKDLEQYERRGIKISANLEPLDLKSLDYKLALTYELQEFVKEEQDKEVKSEVKNIIEYIDTDIREKVNNIFDILNDPAAVKLLQDLIDVDLIGQLNKAYEVDKLPE